MKKNHFFPILTLSLSLISPFLSNLGYQVFGNGTITFETNGGNELHPIKLNVGSTLLLPQTIKMGHHFFQWYLDTEFTKPFTKTVMPLGNTTLFAKWVIGQFTIDFITNGGTNIPSVYGNFGDSILNLPITQKEFMTFAGWYLDLNLTIPTIVPTTIPGANLTLYAKWTENSYTIDYETNGGSFLYPSFFIYNQYLNLPNPIKTGHTFLGWYLDEGLITPLDYQFMSGYNFTVYAKWMVNSYTLNYFLLHHVTWANYPTQWGYTYLIAKSELHNYLTEVDILDFDLESEFDWYYFNNGFYGHFNDAVLINESKFNMPPQNFDIYGKCKGAYYNDCNLPWIRF